MNKTLSQTQLSASAQEAANQASLTLAQPWEPAQALADTQLVLPDFTDWAEVARFLESDCFTLEAEAMAMVPNFKKDDLLIFKGIDGYYGPGIYHAATPDGLIEGIFHERAQGQVYELSFSAAPDKLLYDAREVQFYGYFVLAVPSEYLDANLTVNEALRSLVETYAQRKAFVETSMTGHDLMTRLQKQHDASLSAQKPTKK